jgi:hypothetical protein
METNGKINMNWSADQLQSKWGFHPCNYETYRKLKELHKAYWQAIRDFSKWQRWINKQSQNRKGSQPPQYCPIFFENGPWLRYTKDQNGMLHGKWFSKRITDHGIIDLYHQARMPQQQPVESFSNETLAQINKIYAQWVEYQKPLQSKVAG